MRARSNTLTILTAIAAIVAPLAAAPMAIAGERVELNKTHMIKLPRPASAIIVGDPAIADISVHSDDTIFILGRGYGETDLLVLDSSGQTMMKTDILVTSAKSRNQVNVIKGATIRETYNCAPSCLPSPKLGDSAEFIGLYSSEGVAITNGTANLSEAQDGYNDNAQNRYEE